MGAGPIGMSFTVCLAAVLMKLWDIAWLDSMENESLQVDLYSRYVDDSRNLLHPLVPGWRWDNGQRKIEQMVRAPRYGRLQN